MSAAAGAGPMAAGTDPAVAGGDPMAAGTDPAAAGGDPMAAGTDPEADASANGGGNWADDAPDSLKTGILDKLKQAAENGYDDVIKQTADYLTATLSQKSKSNSNGQQQGGQEPVQESFIFTKKQIAETLRNLHNDDREKTPSEPEAKSGPFSPKKFNRK